MTLRGLTLATIVSYVLSNSFQIFGESLEGLIERYFAVVFSFIVNRKHALKRKRLKKSHFEF